MSCSESTEYDAASSAFDPDEAAELLGLTEKQKLFALAKLKSATNEAAARSAGYGGTDQQLRTVGARTGQSDKVRSFLAWAKRGGAGAPDDPATGDELQRLLSRIARGGDKNAAIRAAEVLTRLKVLEREAAAANPPPFDPVRILNKMVADCGIVGVVLAKASARQFMMDWQPSPCRAVEIVEKLEAALDFHVAELGLEQTIEKLTACVPTAAFTEADRRRTDFHRELQTQHPLNGHAHAPAPPVEEQSNPDWPRLDPCNFHERYR